MTKAELVRKKRLETMDKELEGEAKKIFDWMLDVMDAETDEGYGGETSFWLYDDGFKLNTWFRNKTFDLRFVIVKYDRRSIFARLKKVVEREEGYKVEYEPHSTEWDSPCLKFTITIE